MLLAGATGAALGHDTSAAGAHENRADRGRAPTAAQGPTDQPTPRQRGLVYAGLTEAVRGRCEGVFRVDGTSDPVLCTHGPDPAPPGVDVTEQRSISDLRADVAASRSAPSAQAGTAAVPCIGDGVSGPRIQAIYAVASNRTDRYASTLPLIRDIAAVMDADVNQSASETGGERHIRFVTNADCSLDVAHVVLSPTGDDDFGNTIGELISQGYDDAGRKYHVWMDANILCGVGTIYGDDSQGPGNANNSSVSYARSDTGCWDYAELHELFHNLGAVQLSAPHSSGGFHCTDEYDRMCYDDDGAGPVTMTYPVPVRTIVCSTATTTTTSIRRRTQGRTWRRIGIPPTVCSSPDPRAAAAGPRHRPMSMHRPRRRPRSCLSWDDVPDETGYRIRCWNGADFTTCANGLAAGATQHTIDGLEPDTEYLFEVCAYNGAGEACATPVGARTLAPIASTQIVDDRSAGFSRRGTGWSTSPSGYRNGSLWTPVRRATQRHLATWEAALDGPGRYEVWVRIPAATRRLGRRDTGYEQHRASSSRR